MNDLIINSTDETFAADVLESKIPVLLDFWAPWCGPCVAMSKILDEFATEFAGKVKVVKVNVEEVEQVPQDFRIRSIPAFYLYKDGNEVKKQTGGMSIENLRVFVKDVL